MQVGRHQAGNEEDDPPTARHASPLAHPPQSGVTAYAHPPAIRLRSPLRAHSASDAPRRESAQRHGKRSPRVHANLHRHESHIRKKQRKRAEGQTSAPAEIASHYEQPQQGKRQRAGHREQAVYQHVLPEGKVQHMQAPVEQYRVHVARTDAPNLLEGMVGDGHRIAFIEPHVSVERPGQDEREAKQDNQAMECLRPEKGRAHCSVGTDGQLRSSPCSAKRSHGSERPVAGMTLPLERWEPPGEESF